MSKPPRDAGGFTLIDPPEEGSRRPGARSAEISFGAFVLSLAASCQAELGKGSAAGEEGTGEGGEPSLVLAGQTISILEMLQERTRGNLAQDEEQLLAGLLHDLRMAYVEARDRARSG